MAGMPRFFFDTHDGDRFIPDNEGVELDGIEEAKAEAVKALPDMAHDVLPHTSGGCDLVVTVRDQTDDVVWRVRLSVVVEPLA